MSRKTPYLGRIMSTEEDDAPKGKKPWHWVGCSGRGGKCTEKADIIDGMPDGWSIVEVGGTRYYYCPSHSV